ncbi:MAG: GtrA family protein, partial [Microbacterium sp.]
LAFVVDTVALLALTALTGLLVPSIVAARILSASVNFAMNRRLVFRAQGRPVQQAVRYAALAIVLLASNVVWLHALTDVGVPLLVAKLATEAVLFVTSYGVQSTFVFRAGAPDAEPARPELAPRADAGHSDRIGNACRMETTTTHGRQQ